MQADEEDERKKRYYHIVIPAQPSGEEAGGAKVIVVEQTDEEVRASLESVVRISETTAILAEQKDDQIEDLIRDLDRRYEEYVRRKEREGRRDQAQDRDTYLNQQIGRLAPPRHLDPDDVRAYIGLRDKQGSRQPREEKTAIRVDVREETGSRATQYFEARMHKIDEEMGRLGRDLERAQDRYESASRAYSESLRGIERRLDEHQRLLEERLDTAMQDIRQTVSTSLERQAGLSADDLRALEQDREDISLMRQQLERHEADYANLDSRMQSLDDRITEQERNTGETIRRAVEDIKIYLDDKISHLPVVEPVHVHPGDPHEPHIHVSPVAEDPDYAAMRDAIEQLTRSIEEQRTQLAQAIDDSAHSLESRMDIQRQELEAAIDRVAQERTNPQVRFYRARPPNAVPVSFQATAGPAFRTSPAPGDYDQLIWNMQQAENAIIGSVMNLYTAIDTAFLGLENTVLGDPAAWESRTAYRRVTDTLDTLINDMRWSFRQLDDYVSSNFVDDERDKLHDRIERSERTLIDKVDRLYDQADRSFSSIGKRMRGGERKRTMDTVRKERDRLLDGAHSLNRAVQKEFDGLESLALSLQAKSTAQPSQGSYLERTIVILEQPGVRTGIRAATLGTAAAAGLVFGGPLGLLTATAAGLVGWGVGYGVQNLGRNVVQTEYLGAAVGAGSAAWRFISGDYIGTTLNGLFALTAAGAGFARTRNPRLGRDLSAGATALAAIASAWNLYQMIDGYIDATPPPPEAAKPPAEPGAEIYVPPVDKGEIDIIPPKEPEIEVIVPPIESGEAGIDYIPDHYSIDYNQGPWSKYMIWTPRDDSVIVTARPILMEEIGYDDALARVIYNDGNVKYFPLGSDGAVRVDSPLSSIRSIGAGEFQIDGGVTEWEYSSSYTTALFNMRDQAGNARVPCP